jgi:hypothetical protein
MKSTTEAKYLGSVIGDPPDPAQEIIVESQAQCQLVNSRTYFGTERAVTKSGSC